MSDEILRHYLSEFRDGRALVDHETCVFFDSLIATSDEPLLADILIAWEDRGVTEDELFNLASLMRSRMVRVGHGYPEVVDIVGTGGSRVKTFNVSTAAAFVVAGAGVAVAKHGNRAATSTSGSADVLDVLGVRTDITPEHAQRCLADVGICFMFAPKYHRLSPTLAKVRRGLGRTTVFNNLGPLCNPAGAGHQLIGVWDARLVDKTASVLRRLGTKHSWVVHAHSGLDEIALDGETSVADVTRDEVRFRSVLPAEFGSCSTGAQIPADLDSKKSAQLITHILDDQQRGSDAERVVIVNAAAALFISRRVASLAEGCELAAESIASGRAAEKLAGLVRATQR